MRINNIKIECKHAGPGMARGDTAHSTNVKSLPSLPPATVQIQASCRKLLGEERRSGMKQIRATQLSSD